MKHLFLVGLAALCLVGCEREEKKTIYEPGQYVQKLDARGRRHVIADAKGQPLAKIRVRKDGVRVYGADMTVLGRVEQKGADVFVTRGLGEPTTFEPGATGVFELDGRMRIEAVEHGWAVFDPSARRLGYFAWLPDGRLALRDDYSAAPRVFARANSSEARTPSGEVRLSIAPRYPAAAILPFALEGELDELDRVALGQWLAAHKPAPKPE